ncbi:hypothetical protein CDAR_229701 [Caerostris darwini]|uniref:Uncharacterized protein n=1 Tax=Caerostris darwini TaxID=1538125 RepID=A0AAV4Q256_9ARAC|nr:hypothetical protein CDAR_229701 [Caerostris darwini]
MERGTKQKNHNHIFPAAQSKQTELVSTFTHLLRANKRLCSSDVISVCHFSSAYDFIDVCVMRFVAGSSAALSFLLKAFLLINEELGGRQWGVRDYIHLRMIPLCIRSSTVIRNFRAKEKKSGRVMS